ncbi:sel1 repeat family protein [Acidithiobacillus sp. HP-6]|uniref:tetratricopeptide repeat protein n=1 Tax=unclassified Acidithiobacillus TaxID=2614800 RepID=UPI00187B0367|nr:MULTISPECIES: tetratricopeptide repeat protein [unclassified Acidithiobacillus]MBE7561938.1 sel1 repeat family protein [Acidithiobacillus sp. HP-6]MBE7568610.1 sel1 repeat family protein [Acidithiobacillus sp. HP-2]
MSAHRLLSNPAVLACSAAAFLFLAVPLADAQTTAHKAEMEDSASSQPTDLTTAKLENSIGTRCALGDGVPQNYTLAAQWFEKSAMHGYGKAEYNLGMQYYFGQGVPKDLIKAAYWWNKAAELGVSAAQYNLGNLYFMGQGVPQDYAKAALWWHKAAEAGNTQATKNLEVLARTVPINKTASAVPVADKKAE